MIAPPPSVACADRPVKRANRVAASSISATAITIDEIANAVRMRKPARLPHRVFGVVRQYLDAAFRHHHRLDAGEGEGGNAGAGLGIDWALHTHEIAYGKSSRGQTLARRGGIGNTECGEDRKR